MRILFYIVHPAKFHLFRNTINELKKNHHVDLIINSKDVLSQLIETEGWTYTNLFPNGRNRSEKPSVIKSALKFLLTIIKLEWYLLRKNRYKIYITDDSLVVNGWIRRIPSFIFNDNDIATIKFNKILFYFASKIFSPTTTNLGEFNKKKIPFKGNKALAHLHPSYFIPQRIILKKYNIIEEKYFLIRTAKLNATHDANENLGLTDESIGKIFELNNGIYKILIVTERKLPEQYAENIFRGNALDLVHIINFAKFVISDSGTMATEAAVLGVPNILINKLAKDIGVHKDLKSNGLQVYFDYFQDSSDLLNNYIINKRIKQKYLEKKSEYLKKCDDLNLVFKKNFEKLLW